MTNVPDLPKDLDLKGSDFFTQRGAARLARKIENRWLDAGELFVECRVEPANKHNGQRLYVVRSNLVYGLPPIPRKPKAAIGNKDA